MNMTRYMPNSGLFDLFFKDFSYDEHFAPLEKIHYPVDIYETSKGLHIDIVAIGAKRKDINITSEDGDVLKISYTSEKSLDDSVLHWHSRNITRKNFDFGWKIPVRFNLAKITADYIDGVVTITVPLSDESKPKTIKLG